MQRKIELAIDLRQSGKLTESNELLVKLTKEFPNDASLCYQCAWSYDVLGDEKLAVPYYEKAIALGLPNDELEGALLGLGSTYRTIGKFEKAKEILQKGISLFPSNQAFPVFYAMTLYNLKEHHASLELMIQTLLDTTNNQHILQYEKALRYYSDKLDQVW